MGAGLEDRLPSPGLRLDGAVFEDVAGPLRSHVLHAVGALLGIPGDLPPDAQAQLSVRGQLGGCSLRLPDANLSLASRAASAEALFTVTSDLLQAPELRQGTARAQAQHAEATQQLLERGLQLQRGRDLQLTQDCRNFVFDCPLAAEALAGRSVAAPGPPDKSRLVGRLLLALEAQRVAQL